MSDTDEVEEVDEEVFMTAKKNKKGKEISTSGTVGTSTGGTRKWDWTDLSSLDQKQLDEIIIHVKSCVAQGHECNCRNKWWNQNE